MQAEKKRIKQEQQDLENRIRVNWREVKESLRPGNIAKDAIGSIFKNKTAENMNDDNIFKSSFTYGVSLLAKKFAEKAGEKLSKVFRK
ncbi:MAG: hypothetical protein ABI666_02810 [Ferruginibacter sp.]